MSQPPSEAEPWSVRPRPRSGESLSGWLARVADAHGESLHRFGVTKLRFPAITVRDIDLHAPDFFVDWIVASSGLPRDDVTALLLPRLSAAAGGSAGGITPWVLPLALLARTNFRHGQQACLACLQEGEMICGQWRYAFAVACDQHGGWLIDACPHCDAPLGRLLHARVERCTQCQRSWAHPLVHAPRPFFSPAYSLQQWLTAAWARDKLLRVGGQEVGLADALRGFRFLMRLDARIGGRPPDGGVVERMRTQDRIAWLDRLAQQLGDWPRAFLQRAAEAGVSRDPFPGEKVPQWVRDALAELRPVRPHCRAAPGERDAILASLRRLKPLQWRSRYARRLCALSGVRT